MKLLCQTDTKSFLGVGPRLCVSDWGPPITSRLSVRIEAPVLAHWTYSSLYRLCMPCRFMIGW